QWADEPAPEAGYRALIGAATDTDFPAADDAPSWTDWEPLVEQSGEVMWVLPAALPPAVGMGLALFGLLAAWRRPSRLMANPWLGLILLGAALGCLWLPSALVGLAWWPLVGAALVLVVRVLVRAGRAPKPAPAAVALLFVGVLVHPGIALPSRDSDVPSGLAAALRGWPAEALTVYVIPPRAEDKPSVLVVNALWTKLLELTRPETSALLDDLPPGTPPAVLVQASYRGKVAEQSLHLDAVFQVYAPAADAVLTLPAFDGTLSKEVLVDGAPANLVALRKPRSGYTLKLAAAGLHKLEFSFAVAVQERGAERHVECNLPRVLASHLVVELPRSASCPQVLMRQGSQSATFEGEGQRLSADLGSIAGPLHLLWLEPDKAAAELHFREAYLWDLRPQGSTLWGLVQYSTRGGPVASLRLELPAQLAVRGVKVQRADATGRPADAPNAPVRLSGWRTETVENRRMLRLDLAAPVIGKLDVVLELWPTRPLASPCELLLPAPQGVPVAEAG